MDQPERKLCRNCQRYISTNNYLMHQAHCQRNIVLCQICHEPVLRLELDSHFEEFHVQATCSKCGLKFEKRLQEEHEKNGCPERLIKCNYCEIEYESKLLSEHENYCGSRTENCSKCKQYVMLKHQAQHEKSNCTFPEQRLPLNNTSDIIIGNSPPDDFNYGMFLETDSAFQFPFVETTPITFLDISSSDLNSKRGPAVDISSGLRSFVNLRPNRTSQSKRTNDMPQINTTSSQEDIKKDTKKIFEELQQEQFPYDDDDNLDDIITLTEAYDGGSPTIDIAVSPLDTGSPEVNGDTAGDIFLPCEFCDVLFPEHSLIEHESGCKPEIAHACYKFNNQDNSFHMDQMSFSPVDNRQKASVHHIPRPTERAIVDNLSQCSLTDSSKPCGPEDISLPCEFCQESYPIDLLLPHQTMCEVVNQHHSYTPPPVSFYDSNQDNSFSQSAPKVQKELLTIKQIGQSTRSLSDSRKMVGILDTLNDRMSANLKKEPKIQHRPSKHHPDEMSSVKLKSKPIASKSQSASKHVSRQATQSRSIDGALKTPSRNHTISKKNAASLPEDNFKSGSNHEFIKNYSFPDRMESVLTRDNGKIQRVVKPSNHVSGARPKKSLVISPEGEIQPTRSRSSGMEHSARPKYLGEVAKPSKSSGYLPRTGNQVLDDRLSSYPRKCSSLKDAGSLAKDGKTH